jgi:polyisoprenyl-teichoic acid--peptidoglycan teichoic acid transferase
MPELARKQSPTRAVAKTVLYALFLGILLLLGVLVRWISESKVMSAGLRDYFTPIQTVFHANHVIVLVLGCDDDKTQYSTKILKKSARSDMMMLVNLDFDNKRISGVSIPRDILHKLDDMPSHKMNAFHEIGGNPLAQRAVEDLLDVKIDRVVDIDFHAFSETVDMLGGVTVNVDKDMNYDDNQGGLHIHLKKGRQVLDGEHAMDFVRYRHGDNDLVREARHHQFMLAFKEAMQRHPDRINRVADQMVNIASGVFTPSEAFKLALFGREVKDGGIQLGQVPVVERPHTSALKLDEDNVDAVLKQYHLK